MTAVSGLSHGGPWTAVLTRRACCARNRGHGSSDTPRPVWRRLRWVLVVVVLVVGTMALRAASRGAADASPAPVGRGAPAARPAAATLVTPPPARTAGPAAPTPVIAAPGTTVPAIPAPMVDEGYPVDLARIRAQLPHNGYWTDSAPTDDPEVLRRREADSAGWNVLYGKVLSGTATDGEIRAYFDHRRQVSEDAIEVAELILADHGSELPERDRGLLELAVDMHRTRLSELPRQESEARDRKAEQDRRRAAWQAAPVP